MGYGRTIKESDMKRLKPLFDALEVLPEGEGISYTGHPIQISKDRTIIYTYFDIHSLKGVFRMENPNPEELKITRLLTFTSAVDSAIQLSQFTSPPAKAKGRGGRTFPGFKQSSTQQQQATHRGIDWDKKYGKEEAQEAQPPPSEPAKPAALPAKRPKRPYSPGVEFFDLHAFKVESVAQYHKKVEESNLSEPERVIARLEWQERKDAELKNPETAELPD